MINSLHCFLTITCISILSTNSPNIPLLPLILRKCLLKDTVQEINPLWRHKGHRYLSRVSDDTLSPVL